MSTLTPFTAPETPPPALPGLEASPHAPADLRPGQSSEQQAARRQAALFADELGGLFLEAEPDPMFVLNGDRRLVCGNASLRALLGLGDRDEIIGLRFGELIDCRDAGLLGVHCGARSSCDACGAAQAMASALLGREDVRECRVMLSGRDHPLALNLLVRTAPFERAGERFIIFAAQDMSHEIRRQALERVFFQDILSLARGLEQSMDALAAGASPDLEPDARLMVAQLGALTEEIEWQRELLAAETNDLTIRQAEVDGLALIRNLATRHKGHEAAAGKTIRVEAEEAGPVLLRTDVRLLRRVIGNMLKNALEASAAGQTVTLSCRRANDEVRFSVHNQTAMPRSVQLQIFNRSFSTKGPGRGLGTYSMRLLSVRFLGGRVWFDASPETGVTFHAAYPTALPARPRQASGQPS